VSCCLDRRAFVLTSAVALAGCATVPWYTADVLSPSELALPLTVFTPEDPRVVLHSHLLDAPLLVGPAANGQHVALDLTCTHRACTVGIGRERLECPCHGSQFTFEGEVLNGPAELPLARYPLEERDGFLILRLDSNHEDSV